MNRSRRPSGCARSAFMNGGTAPAFKRFPTVSRHPQQFHVGRRFDAVSCKPQGLAVGGPVDGGDDVRHPQVRMALAFPAGGTTTVRSNVRLLYVSSDSVPSADGAKSSK